MKQAGSYLKKEWEKVLLSIAAIFATVVFASIVMDLLKIDDSYIMSGGMSRNGDNIISDDSFNFLYIDEQKICQENPLEFTYQLHVRKPKNNNKKNNKTRPWWNKTNNNKNTNNVTKKTPVKVTPKPAPKKVEPVVTKVTPKPKPAPKPKPKPKRIRMVEFLGAMTTATGERVALVKSVDPKTGQKTVKYLKKNNIIDGIKVYEFDESGISLQDADGKSAKIKFGETKKITMQ